MHKESREICAPNTMKMAFCFLGVWGWADETEERKIDWKKFFQNRSRKIFPKSIKENFPKSTAQNPSKRHNRHKKKSREFCASNTMKNAHFSPGNPPPQKNTDRSWRKKTLTPTGWWWLLAGCSPPQAPPPSRSHPRHRPFGALVSAKDGGESGVGAGWNSSSHYGIRSGERWLPPPLPPFPKCLFFFGAAPREGGLREALGGLDLPRPPPHRPYPKTMSAPGAAWVSWAGRWRREQVQGKKKKNESRQKLLLATPISAPVPTRTTNEASRFEWFGWGRGLGGLSRP